MSASAFLGEPRIPAVMYRPGTNPESRPYTNDDTTRKSLKQNSLFGRTEVVPTVHRAVRWVKRLQSAEVRLCGESSPAEGYEGEDIRQRAGAGGTRMQREYLQVGGMRRGATGGKTRPIRAKSQRKSCRAPKTPPLPNRYANLRQRASAQPRRGGWRRRRRGAWACGRRGRLCARR
jgi:hypothetical protein